MKDINEVIHLYINSDARYRIKYVDSWEWTVWTKLTEKRYRQLDDKSIENVEYAVRRLSDMTEQEMKGIWEVIFQKTFHQNGTIRWIEKEDHSSCKRWVMSSGVERVGIELSGRVWADSDLSNYKFNPHLVTHYLLKQGFDLFGLIDAGVAIDSNTIKEG